MRRAEGQLQQLASVALERHAAACAEIVEAAPIDETVALLERLPVSRTVDVLRGVTPDTATRLLVRLSDPHARKVLDALDPRRAATLIARLEPEQLRARLDLLDKAQADELRELTNYPRDSAGGLMDPRFLAFRPEGHVREVLRQLRTVGALRVQDIFLVDDDGKLLGSVPLQAVAASPPDRELRGLAEPAAAFVRATASREEVLETLRVHHVASLPVVAFDGQLLGVLRQSELLRATAQEATADLATMFGASKEERALSSPWFAVRKRLPWLEINLLTAFLAAAVVGLFEQTIAQVTALAVLLPVVAGQSGNTGAQALAVTMRGLALREIRMRHWLRVAAKELAVGTLNGIAVAVTTSAAVLIWSRSWALAAVIGISMIFSMMAAALAGALIPMGLTAVGQDPAQSSSIVLTTITDVAGFFSFLGIATLFLSHLPT